MKHTLSLALVSGLTITAGLTAQQLPSTVVFTNTPGVPASIAPGTGGFAFNLGTGTSSAFTGTPVVSSTGAFWAVEAILEGPATTADEVYLVNGTAFLIEGTPDPTDPAFNVGFLDSQIAINDLGEVVATFDTTAATTADEVAVYFNAGGVATLLGRQGDPIAFLPGASYGGTMDSANITSTGDIGFASDFGAGTDLLLRGTTAAGMTTVVARDLDAATAPTGLAGGATDQWENFDFNAYLISDDGLTVVIQGDTNGGTTADDILTVNGAVLLQENVVFGSFATGVTTIGWRVLDPLGNLIVRGENADGLDWIIRNGTVVAQTGDPVVTGSTELLFDGTGGFADTFFSIGGNLAGQFVFAATTDLADQERNAVYVLDDGIGNRRIIARENDPVDVDGNGLFDDDRFIDTFGNDDVALGLSEARVIVNLKDSGNVARDNAILSIPLGGPLARFYPVGPTTAMAPPLAVSFVGEASSSVGPVTYAWDFDNDGIVDSNSPNPTFNFVNPGNYTVKLTVDDGISQGEATVVDLVRIDNVTASFTASPTAGAGPLAVNFTDTSVGPITNWSWDFDNDGTPDSTLQNPTFTYTTPGTYSVSLTVSNAFGSDTFTALGLINVFGMPVDPGPADILAYQFNEVRGDQVANTASTAAAPAFGTMEFGDGWQGDTGRPLFQGNEPGFGMLANNNTTAYSVNTGWNINLGGDWTIMWWQRQQDTTGNSYAFGNDAGIGVLRCWENANQWQLLNGVPSGTFSTTDTSIADGSRLGEWIHLAVTVDSTNGIARWYINGVVDNSVTFVGSAATSAGEFVVAALDNASTSRMNAQFDMDDFRVYGRALLTEEVQFVVGAGETASTSNYGFGCAPGGGSIPTIAGSGLPTLGNPLFGVQLGGFVPASPITLNVSLTTASDPFGGLPLPFDLGAAIPGLFTGCIIEVPLVTALGLGADGAGNALLPIPVPADPALAGAHIYMQAYGLNGSGFSFTQALDINFQN
jgi:PKD repeat protein